MNTLSFLGFMMLTIARVQAQNTISIQQQGKEHTISVSQSGSGNTAVINQSSAGSSNQAVISQSGAGNGITVIQSNGSNILISQIDSTGPTSRSNQSSGADTTLNLIETTDPALIQPGNEPRQFNRRQKKLSEKKSKSNP